MLSLPRRVPLAIARSYATLKPAPFGQPRPETHPHLLAHGEITPGVQSTEYEARRARLMRDLPDDSIVVAVAAPVQYMSESSSIYTPRS